MTRPINISNFSKLNVPEKIRFLEHEFMRSILHVDGAQLCRSLKQIVLNDTENTFVRRIGLKRLTELAGIRKIKDRQVLTVLLDDWLPSSDVHIELQRLKDLFLFYDKDPDDIEKVYQSFLSHEETELIAESNLNLGHIHFQKALIADNIENYLGHLNESKRLFLNAEQVIENRIDAFFYFKISSILISLSSGENSQIQNDIRDVSQILFDREAYSMCFGDIDHDLQFSLYKILNALQKILNSKPDQWTDFKIELESIMISFLEIKETNFKSRLNQNLPKTLAEKLEKNHIQPFFTVNLNSDINRVIKLKCLYSLESKEHQFLTYLQTAIEDSDKKKIEIETLRNKLQLTFPHRPPDEIEQLINSNTEPGNYIDIFKKLSDHTSKELFQKIIYCCTILQSEHKYWGTKVDENEKNRYITNLLKAAGYNVADQTQWSKSSTGINPGEIDIFIHNKDNTPQSIIEALNLNSIDKKYLDLHIDKLFDYDTTGLQNNYMLVYYLGKNIVGFWDKYQAHIKTYKYKYECIQFEIDDSVRYSEVKIGHMTHFRNGKEITVSHIIINMAER